MAIIPNNNIDTRLVANTIGVNSDDVGVLCGGTAASAGRINKWAKYKPVRFAHDFTDGYPNWWKGTDLGRGLDIPEYTSLYALAQAVRSGITISYLPPRGGPDEPFRLGDFRGYDPDALPPVQSGQLAGTYYLTAGIPVFSVMTTQQSGGWMTADDLYGDMLGSLYYGAGICKVGATAFQYVTEGSPITTSGGGAVKIPLNGYSTGDYEIYQFLCENRKTSLTSPDIANRFIPLQNNYMQVVTVKSGSVRLQIMLVWSDNEVTGTGTIVNEGQGTITVIRQDVIIRYMNNPDSMPFENGEQTFAILDTFTVPGDTRREVPISVGNVLYDLPQRGGKVKYTVNQGQYQANGLIGQEM